MNRRLSGLRLSRLRLSRLLPRNLFSLLLSFWARNRRLILVAVIAAGLGTYIASLSPETRRSVLVGLLAQRSLVTLLLIFSLLMLSLLLSAGQRLDLWVFTLFNLRGYHPLWLDRVMWAFTQIGNGAVGILLGIFLYFFGNRRLGIELLLGILTLWLTVETIKAIVERSRPYLTIEAARIIGWRERGLSFPSGHTSQAFFMATLFSHTLNVSPLVAASFYASAVIVGFSRIYVGAHYPRDVLAGGVLGTVWGILINLINNYLLTGQFY
jgi:membrane-associated phospholipid phosphatase